MTNSLKPNDIVKLHFPLFDSWLAYMRGLCPSILGVGEDIVIRFVHQHTGLYRFLACDVEGPEPSPGQWPIPDSQGKGEQGRVTYRSESYIRYGIEDEPPPAPQPEPLPEPPPAPLPPEPEPEPDVTIATITVPGQPLIFGDWGEAGEPIMLVGIGGNVQQILTGSKFEHGPGGFEFLVYGKGLHLLSIAGYRFNVWVTEEGKAVKVLFDKGQQQQMVRLASRVAIGRSRAMLIMERYPHAGFSIV